MSNLSRDRQVGRESDIGAAETAARCLGLETRFCSGLVSHDVDRTADGVAAEQRALGAFQDFNAIDVQKVLIRANRAREEDAVEIHAHARVDVEGEVILADAANRRREYRGVARERRAGIEIHVRSEVAQGVNVCHTLCPQRLRRKRADRDRDVLDILLTPLGRDDDFLQRLTRRGGDLSWRLLGKGGCAYEHRNTRTERPCKARRSGVVESDHVVPPVESIRCG